MAGQLLLAHERRAVLALAHSDDVAAAAERLAGAGDDDDVDGVVALRFGKRIRPGIRHLPGEGVHPLRPVQGDGGDAVGDLVSDGLAHLVLFVEMKGCRAIVRPSTARFARAQDEDHFLVAPTDSLPPYCGWQTQRPSS